MMKNQLNQSVNKINYLKINSNIKHQYVAEKYCNQISYS